MVQESNHISFPDDLPAVPVFDRTLPVKQIHVLETLDLLVLRADKGVPLKWLFWEEQEGGLPTAANPRVIGSGCVSHVTVSFPGISAVVLWWPTCWDSGGKESFILPGLWRVNTLLDTVAYVPCRNTSQLWFVCLPWESQQVI